MKFPITVIALLLVSTAEAQWFPLPGPGRAASGEVAGLYNGTSSKMQTTSPWATTYPLTFCADVEPDFTSGDWTMIAISTSSTAHRLSLNSRFGDDLQGLAGSDTVQAAQLNTVLPNGVKTRVCAIFISSSDRRVCAGSSCAQNTNSIAALSGINRGTVGARTNSGSDTGRWPGKIKESCIWTSALSDANAISYTDGTNDCEDLTVNHLYRGASGTDLVGAVNLTVTDVTEVAW